MKEHLRRWPFLAIYCVACLLEFLAEQLKKWAGERLVAPPDDDDDDPDDEDE